MPISWSARSSSAVSSAIAGYRERISVRRSWTLVGCAGRPGGVTCAEAATLFGMCGRYTLTTNDRGRLGERFGAMLPEDGGLERYNVAPTEEIAVVVVSKTGEREGHLVRWGLVPGYATSLKGGPPMFNARSETVGTKAPFKALLSKQRGRCLILADGFYEWLRPEDKKAPRVPFRFTVDGGEPFAFAGLWNWTKLDGEWLASATILTCAPNPGVAPAPDPLPVVPPRAGAQGAG